MSETWRETVINERSGKSYQIVHHKSGLDLLLDPMEGFFQTSAIFGTRYGSINNCFKTAEDEDFIRVPDGIAHYLEHKLFENEDCGVFELYAETGADGNAMTGFENTLYVFSCTENFESSLRILLDFVQKPYFTKENVEKEQGIIAQEIRMTLDKPRRRVFYELLNAMYHEHPIKIDIAGTEESIKEITPELLYKCYYAFYDLHNMALAVAGAFDADRVIEICDEMLKPAEDKKLEVRFPDEPPTVVRKRTVTEFGVGVPLFSIGIKCAAYDNSELMKKEVTADVMMTLLCGRMSKLYKRLTSDGLMNTELSREVFCGCGYFTLIFSGSSEQPDKVMEYLFEAVADAKKNGFDRRQFELIKKAEYGSAVREMNEPESCAEEMIGYHFYGYNAFDPQKFFAEVEYDDVVKALDEFFKDDNYSISILK